MCDGISKRTNGTFLTKASRMLVEVKHFLPVISCGSVPSGWWGSPTGRCSCWSRAPGGPSIPLDPCTCMKPCLEREQRQLFIERDAMKFVRWQDAAVNRDILAACLSMCAFLKVHDHQIYPFLTLSSTTSRDGLENIWIMFSSSICWALISYLQNQSKSNCHVPRNTIL